MLQAWPVWIARPVVGQNECDYQRHYQEKKEIRCEASIAAVSINFLFFIFSCDKSSDLQSGRYEWIIRVSYCIFGTKCDYQWIKIIIYYKVSFNTILQKYYYRQKTNDYIKCMKKYAKSSSFPYYIFSLIDCYMIPFIIM